MKIKNRLKIAIQKNGKLHNDSLDLLSRCGLKFRIHEGSLLCHCENLAIDLLLVRDDDIPTLVSNNVCDLGIVGENILLEKFLESDPNLQIIKKLGFGACRLAIALPSDKTYMTPASLNNLRIATSYPNLLAHYLNQHQINAEIIIFSGSVEVAPRLGIADAICDLVSTGRTLEEHNLKEVTTVTSSQAVLIQSKNMVENELVDLILRRTEGVIKAQESKYIMFHAPKSQVTAIKQILPGCETPTIMTLDGIPDKVAVHLVSSEGVFWTTLEKLKSIGASSILVLPIEKMLN